MGKKQHSDGLRMCKFCKERKPHEQFTYLYWGHQPTLCHDCKQIHPEKMRAIKRLRERVRNYRISISQFLGPSILWYLSGTSQCPAKLALDSICLRRQIRLCRKFGKTWKTTTENTAKARNPSMSDRYWVVCEVSVTRFWTFSICWMIKTWKFSSVGQLTGQRDFF